MATEPFVKLVELELGESTSFKLTGDEGEYDVKILGHNYRMTDFQASLGYNQIISYKKRKKNRYWICD